MTQPITLNRNGSYEFPSVAYNQDHYALVCVNIALIPFFRLFFAHMQERYSWKSRDDWLLGYQAFAEIEEMLMAGCLTDLVESNNRLYRLLDSALNGTVYTAPAG